MKKVVIIGGGFAGSYCTQQLQNYFKVTLIDSKDYFEFTPSVLRTLVEPEHAEKIQVVHKKYLKKTQIVNGEVEKIIDKEVFVDNNLYTYDYLIICTGSKYNTPIKEENLVIADRAHELRKYADKLKTAKSVLIIGGGIVGVELAAEIIEKFPNKEVTIVHSKNRLMERIPYKAQIYATNFLKNRNVNIILNKKATINREGNHITNKGTKIKAEMAFLCAGIMPNYEPLKNYCSSSLNEMNYLCVNKNLQVIGHKNIFAAGDITNISEEKLAQSAEKQARMVVRNILNLEQGKDLEKYIPKPRVIVISLGKHNGIIFYKNIIITGRLAGILKRVIEWKTMKRFK